MANRYWVPGGNGLWSSTTNWSTASGGASGASVPGSADGARFDAASGAGASTLDFNITVNFVNFQAFTGSFVFGTNTVTTVGTGTIFVGGIGYTGATKVIVSNPTSTAITVTTGIVPEAAATSFNFIDGTYPLTFLSIASSGAKDVDFTGFAGTWGATSTGSIYGNLTLSTGMTLTASASSFFFAATSGTQLITTNAKTLDFPITFTGAGGTRQLQDAMTIGSTRTATLGSGTLDLNGKTLTTGLFSSSSSTARTLAFGSGNIVCNAAGGALWDTTTSTNLTITGTPVVNISNSGAVATSVVPGTLAEASALSFNITTGTYTLTFLGTASNTAKNINFTGFSGAWGTTAAAFIYGNLTLSSTMALTGSTQTMTFGATSGTKTITSNAKTIDFPITFNGVGGTFRLIDAMTLGSTRTLTLTNGTLDLNGMTLTTGFFNSNNANTRTLAFGTGNITCNGAGGTLWTTSTITGLTVTGTPVVNISYSGATATTLQQGIGISEANSISFNITAGTYSLNFFGSSANTGVRDLNFTGFSGTLAAITGPAYLYGDLTFSSGMTTAAVNPLTFASTSATARIITSNGTAALIQFIFNGVGGTWRLADAATTQNMTQTNGTLDLNGKTLTAAAYTTATGTKNLTFNGGILAITNATTTSFNNAQPTGYTTTAGTGTGKISMTAATAKTFVGGGSTFNCTLSNDGAGALTISGANTFTNIANGVQPTSFVFPIATTQTVTNWNVSGTAGNLVTITSGTAGTPALLSKASGTVSSNYLSLKDNTALGGAT